MSETHPKVYDDFKNGRFSIARTEKHFSQESIDLTLEQTINADSANQKTGIAAFTNNITA